MGQIDRSQQLIGQVQRIFPNLDQLYDRLDQEPDTVLNEAFPPDDPGVRPRAIVRSPGLEAASDAADEELDTFGLDELDACIQQLRRRALDQAKQGLDKIRTHGPQATLTAAEEEGIEAIIVPSGRPAIRIMNARMPLRQELPAEWQSLDDVRPDIEQNVLSVGRIQMQSGPIQKMVGTGFLVGPNVIMTNRHVATFFSAPGQNNRWAFTPGVSAEISYADDPDTDPGMQLPIEDVIGVHATLDLALLRVAALGNGTGPTPLRLASERPSSIVDRLVYVLGYPARDTRATRSLVRVIFGDIFRVKRLQPGAVMTVLEGEGLFDHDCSTLGGNSGSCVIDIDANEVVGLHFRGQEKQFNRAVALWELRDDPLLRAANLNWV